MGNSNQSESVQRARKFRCIRTLAGNRKAAERGDSEFLLQNLFQQPFLRNATQNQKFKVSQNFQRFQLDKGLEFGPSTAGHPQVYMVRKGVVRLRFQDGQQLMKSGDLFGEKELLSGRHFDFKGTCLQQTELLLIQNQYLEKLIVSQRQRCTCVFESQLKEWAIDLHDLTRDAITDKMVLLSFQSGENIQNIDYQTLGVLLRGRTQSQQPIQANNILGLNSLLFDRSPYPHRALTSVDLLQISGLRLETVLGPLYKSILRNSILKKNLHQIIQEHLVDQIIPDLQYQFFKRGHCLLQPGSRAQCIFLQITGEAVQQSLPEKPLAVLGAQALSSKESRYERRVVVTREGVFGKLGLARQQDKRELMQQLKRRVCKVQNRFSKCFAKLSLNQQDTFQTKACIDPNTLLLQDSYGKIFRIRAFRELPPVYNLLNRRYVPGLPCVARKYVRRSETIVVQESSLRAQLMGMVQRRDVSLRIVVRVVQGALGILQYLNSMSIILRNLSTQSISLEECGEVHLQDVRHAKQAFRTSSVVGVPFFMAPEVILGSYSSKCDLYSLGVIMYQMLTGEMPFKTINQEPLDIFKQTLEFNPSTVASAFDQSVSHVLRALLEPDPKKRPSCGVLKGYPLLAEPVKVKIEVPRRPDFSVSLKEWLQNY